VHIVNLEGTEAQEGDAEPSPFTLSNEHVANGVYHVVCYRTHTTPEIHRMTRETMHLSVHIQETKKVHVIALPLRRRSLALRNATGIPSIQSMRHMTQVLYPHRLSNSMPEELQEAMLRTVSGLKNVMTARSAYGVEYNFVDPGELTSTLETKHIKGLFLAGQINGTTGYGEAAAQGVAAGINTRLASRSSSPSVLTHADGYIGVMIDGLVTRGVLESYCMFTSRSGYRMMMQNDNADLRLTEKGHAIGVVPDERWAPSNRERDELVRAACPLLKANTA
jgi:tRNA uridine 5-carboxymethylaminomethyl modification enzyme